MLQEDQNIAAQYGEEDDANENNDNDYYDESTLPDERT